MVTQSRRIRFACYSELGLVFLSEQNIINSKVMEKFRGLLFIKEIPKPFNEYTTFAPVKITLLLYNTVVFYLF